MTRSSPGGAPLFLDPRTRDDTETTITKIKAITDSVQGWLDDADGAHLYHLVRDHAPSGVVVELGSWKGKSTIWLASAVRDRRGQGQVYAVDTWEGTGNEAVHTRMLASYAPHQLRDEFTSHIQKARLSDFVTPVQKTTGQAACDWQEGISVGLLYIDADHDYIACRNDFEKWSPLVMPGGYIVFDDVPHWPGPTRVVAELPPSYEFVAKSENQWVVKKGLRSQ